MGANKCLPVVLYLSVVGLRSPRRPPIFLSHRRKSRSLSFPSIFVRVLEWRQLLPEVWPARRSLFFLPGDFAEHTAERHRASHERVRRRSPEGCARWRSAHLRDLVPRNFLIAAYGGPRAMQINCQRRPFKRVHYRAISVRSRDSTFLDSNSFRRKHLRTRRLRNI